MAGAITAAMVATAIAPVAGAQVNQNADTYSDVAVTNSHFDNIMKAKELGFLQGSPDGTFKPAVSLTRSNVVKALGKYVVAQSGGTLESYDVRGVTPFSDVPSTIADKELYNYSLVVKKAGIFSGDSNKLNPLNNITRQQMAKVLVNAFDLKDLPNRDSKVTDNNKALAEYRSYINILSENGVTTQAEFMPDTNVSRAQFASFLVRSYEASNVVAAAVNSVNAVNAKELQITFTQPIKESSVIDDKDDLIEGIVKLNSADARSLTDNAYLSADGKTLTLVAADKWNGSYAFEVVKNKVEAANGEKVGEYKVFLTASDTARPTFAGVSYEPSGQAKFSFSEPLNESASDIASKLVVSGGTSVTISADDIEVADDSKSFKVTLPASMTKDASYTFTFTGLADFAGNLLSPNPLSATVVKADRDTVKPTVTSVTALDTGKLQVTFSEKIRSTGAAVKVGDTTYTTYTLDTTGTVATFTNVGALTEGVKSVTISDALDLAGLKMNEVTRVIQVNADTTAPAYVNHTVETVGGTRYLVVSYNEEITVNSSKEVAGTYVNSNNITLPVAGITGDDITRGTDKKSVRIKLPATAGTYTLGLPTGLVEDTSAATNDSAARNVTFTVGTAVDATKPVTEDFYQVGNKVTVKFDRPVTAATALNVNNYSIDGVSSPFSSAIFKGDAQTVELTLKNDVITTNGVRNYTVSNVATSAGSVMVSETDTYDFKENVRPIVQSAKVINATQIEVTLSEALKLETAGTDFDVFQGSTTALAENGAEVIAGTNNNKVVITLATPLTSLNGITLGASSTIDLADVNGNVVNFVGPIAVSSN